MCISKYCLHIFGASYVCKSQVQTFWLIFSHFSSNIVICQEVKKVIDHNAV